MLGADGIFVELTGEAYELRPSLRASMRLVRRHQLPGLLAAAQDFNLTIIMDVLREAAISPKLLLTDIAAIGLGNVRNQLTGPLARFVLAVAGIDPDDTSPPVPAPGKQVSPEETFTQLFGFATGWLGWTPEEAWNATPSEIIAAKNGRTDMITDVLKAILGTGNTDKPDTQYTPEQVAQIIANGTDPAFDRAGLAKLNASLSR